MSTSFIFKDFQSTDVVTGRIQSVSNPLWTSGDFELNNFYTSSIQTIITGANALEPLSGLYYLNVYDSDPNIDPTAEIQFSISYGNQVGSGSFSSVNSASIYPTQTIYTQYKNIILSPNESQFTFATASFNNGIASQDIYVISISGNRYKENFDAGQFQFALYGNNGISYFIDDSSQSTQNGVSTNNVFNIVSGTLDDGIYLQNGSSSLYAGLVYPTIGTIILYPKALGDIVGSNLYPNTSSNATQLNQYRLFSAISNVFSTNSGSFIARSTEYIPSEQYFIRAGNQEFNYSNNPTFVLSNQTNQSLNGQLLFTSFYTDPHTYVTTVGLYDANNDLVAVAKLSQPIEKTFENELLIKVKLNF